MPATLSLAGDIVLEPIPKQLPVVTLVLGLELLLLGAVQRLMHRSSFPPLTQFDRVFGVAALGLGYLLSALSLLQGSFGWYAAYLFLLFRTVEGAAGVRFYRKVVYVYRNRRVPSSGGKSVVSHYLLLAFVAFAGVGLFVHVASTGPVYRSVAFDSRAIYTGTTFLLSALGVYWRLRPISDSYSSALLTGFVLSIAGAELYNYAFLGTEILLYLAGTVAYGVGFWGLVVCWRLGLVPTTSGSATP